MPQIHNSQFGTGSTGTSSSLNLGFTPTAGRTLLVAVAVPTASAPATGLTDSAGNSYTLDVATSGAHGGLFLYFYRCQSLVGVPTSVTVVGTTGSFAGLFEVLEVSGLAVNPVSQTFAATTLGSGFSLATHAINITTTQDNQLAFLGVRTNNSRSLNAATNGFAVWTTALGNVSGVHNADLGATGAKTTTLTYSSAIVAVMSGVIYNARLPLVSVSDPVVNAASGSVTFTVSLDIAPTSTVTVQYSTANGSALAGYDYTAATGTVTFLAGETSKTVNVSVTPP